jgi:flagellar biosynthetic protein FliQ
MTPEMVTELGRQALETMLLVSAPVLGLSLVVGLVVSAFQAMTQLNEATLTFVPKVLVLFGALLLFLPWMLNVLTTFTRKAAAEMQTRLYGYLDAVASAEDLETLRERFPNNPPVDRGVARQASFCDRWHVG